MTGYWTGRTGEVLRNAAWTTRTAAVVVVGVLTFAQGPKHPQALPLQIAGFAIAVAAMCGWAALDLPPGTDPSQERWLPLVFGVITVVSGLACTPAGGSFIVILAGIAAMGAGSDTGVLSSWTVTGLGVLATEVGALIFGDSVSTMLGFPLAMVGALLLGHNRRSYRVQAAQSAAMLAQAGQLQEQQRRADVLDERARIAREIHDVLAHSLGALGIQIQAARAVLTDSRDVDRALDVLATAQRMASDGLVETRRAVHALRSGTLPLRDEIAAVAGRHTGRYRAPVTATVGGEPRELPPAATMTLLRIVQEGLVNAAKHAPGQPVDVHLDYTAEQVRLTIANPLGRRWLAGPDLATANTGYGLAGMQERLLLTGGSLTAGARDGRWVVTATLPHAVLAPAGQAE